MKYIMLITTLDLCFGWGLHIPPFYCDILNIKIDYVFLQIPSNPFQTLKKKKEKQEQLHESLLEIIVLAASETSGGYIIYISNFTWLNCQFLNLCAEKRLWLVLSIMWVMVEQLKASMQTTQWLTDMDCLAHTCLAIITPSSRVLQALWSPTPAGME